MRGNPVALAIDALAARGDSVITRHAGSKRAKLSSPPMAAKRAETETGSSVHGKNNHERGQDETDGRTCEKEACETTAVGAMAAAQLGMCTAPLRVTLVPQMLLHSSGLWRNGSASDSRSDGWEFESLWPQFSIRAAER